ncbi:MAG: PhzF family phenazine biosynthesis protein [Pseudomonadota bacterium]
MKTQLKLFQVDAFATQIFRGNPAAVCPLEAWLPDNVMQAAAEENNLSETAFFVPCTDGAHDYHIRWFTPLDEVDLCGHATLAAAHIIFSKLGFAQNTIRFKSRSGLLAVEKHSELLALNFPAWTLEKVTSHEALARALNVEPAEVYKSHDWLVVLETEKDVLQLTPDFHALKNIDGRGVIVTAPGQDEATDFVSRAFFPKLRIDEDPVTGSAHCALVPYWAKRLGKSEFKARQVSRRIGELECALLTGGRVRIAGEARLYLEGVYDLP